MVSRSSVWQVQSLVCLVFGWPCVWQVLCRGGQNFVGLVSGRSRFGRSCGLQVLCLLGLVLPRSCVVRGLMSGGLMVDRAYGRQVLSQVGLVSPRSSVGRSYVLQVLYDRSYVVAPHLEVVLMLQLVVVFAFAFFVHIYMCIQMNIDKKI